MRLSSTMNTSYFYVLLIVFMILFFFSSRRGHTRSKRDWSSDVCSSDLKLVRGSADVAAHERAGQDQAVGARQVGHGAYGGRDVLLTDERDCVDADPLAA